MSSIFSPCVNKKWYDVWIKVWLCLGATLAVVAPTLAFISGMYEKLTKETGSSPASIIQVEDVAQTTLFLLSHLTNHGNHGKKVMNIYFLCALINWLNAFSGYHVRLNSRARTILIVIWLLMTIVLANGYAGVLFSFLSVPKLEPIVNSLDELAESKTVQLVTLEKTTWALQLMVKLIRESIFNFFLHIKKKSHSDIGCREWYTKIDCWFLT